MSHVHAKSLYGCHNDLVMAKEFVSEHFKNQVATISFQNFSQIKK
jgi:hypothetical protein